MNLLKTKMLHVIVLILASSIGVISMSIASAADLSSKEQSCEILSDIGGASCGTASDSKVSGIIKTVIQILVIAGGIIAVIMIIVGGLKYVTSSGDSQAISSAKKTIIYAIVGLVVVAFAQIIVQFVLNSSSSGENEAINETAEQAELSRKERSYESALESGDNNKISTAEKEYDEELEEYEKKLESKDSSSSRGSSTKSPSGNRTKEFKSFKVATFNVLGSGHTAPGGKKALWPNGDVRFAQTMQAFRDKKISVAALQEMHSQDQKRFRDKYSDNWGSAEGSQDFVIWRKDQWRKIEVRKITIPYFSGENRSQPYVLLEQRSTGKRIWFMGVHNPANVSGQVADRRKRALEIERDAINKIKKSGYPVFIGGDFNDGGDGKISAQCMLTPLMTNVFGNKGSGPCGKPKADAAVDHIFVIGASELRATGPRVDSSFDDRKISDHPLVTAIMVPR